jgi:hypothetical protein
MASSKGGGMNIPIESRRPLIPKPCAIQVGDWLVEHHDDGLRLLRRPPRRKSIGAIHDILKQIEEEKRAKVNS